MSSNELSRIAWCISTRSSGAGGQCVEAGPLTDGSGRVALRHSYHRDGSAFLTTHDEWNAFIAAAKTGTFDF